MPGHCGQVHEEGGSQKEPNEWTRQPDKSPSCYGEHLQQPQHNEREKQRSCKRYRKEKPRPPRRT